MRNRRLFELPLEQRTIQLLGVHFDVQGRFLGDNHGVTHAGDGQQAPHQSGIGQGRGTQRPALAASFRSRI